MTQLNRDTLSTPRVADLMEAGAHVFVEKPLATTAADAARVAAKAGATGRKVVAGIFTVACAVALSCAATYSAGAAFLLLNKVNPAQARVGSIALYWRAYANEPMLRRKLVGSIVGSSVVWLVLLPGAMFVAARPRRPLHGDARFAKASEISRASLPRPMSCRISSSRPVSLLSTEVLAAERGLESESKIAAAVFSLAYT